MRSVTLCNIKYIIIIRYIALLQINDSKIYVKKFKKVMTKTNNKCAFNGWPKWHKLLPQI